MSLCCYVCYFFFSVRAHCYLSPRNFVFLFLLNKVNSLSLLLNRSSIFNHCEKTVKRIRYPPLPPKPLKNISFFPSPMFQSTFKRSLISLPHVKPRFYSSATPWKSLSTKEQKQFCYDFVDLYRSKNCTKNYYKQLIEGMEEFNDIPSVFGLLYNDLIEKKAKNEVSAEFDEDFFKLVK